MTYSKRELSELRLTIDESLVKQFGSTDHKLSDSALEYLDRGYDRRKMKKKFMKMMSESDAERFAFRLDDIAIDFMVKAKDDRRSGHKRKESNGRSSPKESKKFHQELDIVTPSLPPKYLNKAEKLDADKIKNMMLNAQKMILKRKQEMNIPQVVASAPPRPILPLMTLPRDPPQPEDDYMSESMLQAQKATELQMNIQRQLASAGLPLKPKKPSDDVMRPMPLILDDKGRTIDSAGQEVELKAYQPTLKANIRAMKRDQYKAATERQIEEISDTQYFDGRVKLKPSARTKRSFKFHIPGKFEQLANRLRTKAQLERLQSEIACVAKKTGIASATRLAISLPRKPDGDYEIPDIEWWDSVIVDPDTFNDDITFADENIQGITNLVEHPIQLRPPTEPLVPREMPVMLTKQERKKMRRQKRSENLQEIQEKIRLGLIPAPEAKVRVANLMRVLGTEAVQDPTKVEAHVRAQMAKRISEHEKTNRDRKLTKEQRSEKRSRKLMEDTSLGVCVTIFRIVDLTSASIKFKIEANCKQLHMTGIVILHRECNIVIVEGGPKQQIKFKRLMMKRIKWEDKNLLKEEGGLDADSLGPNNCIIVWEGSVQRRSFGDIKFKMCPTENMCRDTLRRNNVAHYWDLAYRAAINQEPVEVDNDE